MKNKTYVIAAIPAFNEEKTIAKVVLQTQKYVDDVFVCDDGSKDLTAIIAEKLGATVIRHERNLGYGAALQTLFKKARDVNADIVVTIDADGQHNPHTIPKILEPIKNGEADIVLGSRFIKKHTKKVIPLHKKLGIEAVTTITNLMYDTKLKDVTSGLRTYNRKAIQLIDITEQGMGATTEILIRAKEKMLKIIEVPTTIEYKGLETSTNNFLFLGADILSGVLRNKAIKHPILSFALPGTLILITGLIFGLWTIITYINDSKFLTNFALVSLGATILGFSLITSAIILFAIITIIKKQSSD